MWRGLQGARARTWCGCLLARSLLGRGVLGLPATRSRRAITGRCRIVGPNPPFAPLTKKRWSPTGSPQHRCLHPPRQCGPVAVSQQPRHDGTAVVHWARFADRHMKTDTVATDEIQLWHDKRPARQPQIAVTVAADRLNPAADVDGFYFGPTPTTTPTPSADDVISTITPEIEAQAGDAGSGLVPNVA